MQYFPPWTGACQRPFRREDKERRAAGGGGTDVAPARGAPENGTDSPLAREPARREETDRRRAGEPAERGKRSDLRAEPEAGKRFSTDGGMEVVCEETVGRGKRRGYRPAGENRGGAGRPGRCRPHESRKRRLHGPRPADHSACVAQSEDAGCFLPLFAEKKAHGNRRAPQTITISPLPREAPVPIARPTVSARRPVPVKSGLKR